MVRRPDAGAEPPSLVNRAFSGEGSGPGGTFAYDFRFYALVQLGMLLIAGGVACLGPAGGLTRGEPHAWRATLWATAALLAINVPLIPVQGLALSPFVFVNLVALMVTRKRFGLSSVEPSGVLCA